MSPTKKAKKAITQRANGKASEAPAEEKVRPQAALRKQKIAHGGFDGCWRR